MTVHIMDSIVFGDSVGTADMRRVFEETASFQRWLDVEAALAKAQAAMGMIQKEASEIIAAKADVALIDLEAVKASGKRTGHSLLGLLSDFRRVIAHDHSRYLHFGATTQDIIDTAMMLMIKDGYGLAMERLAGIMHLISDLAGKHAQTIMVGRTHGGHALPITFGFKAAIWLSELSRQHERWTMARERILVGNMTGAVGNFASWGKQGFEVQKRTLDLLGLGVPETVWHSSRDRIAEMMTLCALLAGTGARIAREVYNLSKTEIGELLEPSAGKIGSSTMPHKRNPIHSEWIMVLEREIRANASVALEVMGQENERDASRWKNEWIAVPESFVYLSGLLNHLMVLLGGLTVNEGRMLRNTDLLQGMLLSEQVMFLLEKHFPLPVAHEKVYLASMRAFEKETHLIDELMSDPEVAAQCQRADIEKVLDPAGYLGLSAEVAQAVKLRVDRLLASVAAT
ncbi:MAG: adenylosuccinate lyase [Deltaproteobacteria bacterium]|nr:adenylosuccinate lyase [Deltaproteobacteria bacterium]